MAAKLLTEDAEVLGVISSSPGDLQPVFDSMLRNAVRICDAKFGLLVRFDGEAFHMAADGLGGEVFDQLDLLVRERADFLAINH